VRSEAATEHHNRMFALHDHFTLAAYEAVHDLTLELLKETAALETADAVSVMREATGMLHDRAEDIDGLALAHIHGLDITGAEADKHRDQMIAQYEDPEAAVDDFLRPDRDRHFHWRRVLGPKEQPGYEGGAPAEEEAAAEREAFQRFRKQWVTTPEGKSWEQRWDATTDIWAKIRLSDE
jgi:hypothetical protein